MRNYVRVMLGRRSMYAEACLSGGFIGVDFDIDQDLTKELPDDWRQFNAKQRPLLLSKKPEMSKVGAGLACGFVWTVAKGIKRGDMVLSPDGNGYYRVGEILGDYYYAKGEILPHRRKVAWLDIKIDRADMSESLRNSSGSIGTVSNITAHFEELEKLLNGSTQTIISTNDKNVEDPSAFALEKHLEDFLVQNWNQTELGQQYDIFEEDGERVGQQYLTDTGPIDVLAIKKDKSEILIVELKRGRASDMVVGQVLRYMGYVKQELAEDIQKVRGVIIALEDDVRIKRALAMTPDISFYRYEVNFKLIKS
jgi:restriction system protein